MLNRRTFLRIAGAATALAALPAAVIRLADRRAYYDVPLDAMQDGAVVTVDQFSMVDDRLWYYRSALTVVDGAVYCASMRTRDDWPATEITSRRPSSNRVYRVRGCEILIAARKKVGSPDFMLHVWTNQG